MPVAAGARQDTWKITVAVQLTSGGALTNLGTFDTYSGGETTATDTKHRPGGAPFEVSYGGAASRGNVTVARVFNAVKGDTTLLKRLDAVAGRARASVSRQPLDGDLIPFGEPVVTGGTLIRVTGPAADSNASGTAMLELEISTAGSLG
jgi:hypothetical protein